MKKGIRIWAFILGIIGLLSIPALASGPLVYEMGSKASAQAGAFTARADDPTAVFYNPAGLAFQEGTQLTFNMTYLKIDGKYDSPTLGSYKDQAKNFFIPATFFGMKVTDSITFGFGISPHYSLATDWSDMFPGRFASRHAKMLTMTMRPVLAFKLNDNNALAIGIDYHDSQLNLIRSLDTTLFSTDATNGFVNPYNIIVSEGTIDTHLRDQSLGWNLAYMGKWDPWSVGLTYQSKASFRYDGYSSFETAGSIGGHSAAFAGTETSLSIDAVPATARLGVAYSSKPWTVEFDAAWTQWGQWDMATAEFDRHTATTIRVPVPGVGLVPVTVGVVQDEEFLFDWNNTMTYRLGFGYKLSDKYELRWGILYDEAPVPEETTSPVLPDEDRWSVQFGTGYTGDKIGIDWYVMYLKADTASISQDNIYRYNSNGLYTYGMTPDGEYKFKTWIMGFQLNYKF